MRFALKGSELRIERNTKGDNVTQDHLNYTGLRDMRTLENVAVVDEDQDCAHHERYMDCFKQDATTEINHLRAVTFLEYRNIT